MKGGESGFMRLSSKRECLECVSIQLGEEEEEVEERSDEDLEVTAAPQVGARPDK